MLAHRCLNGEIVANPRKQTVMANLKITELKHLLKVSYHCANI